MLNQVALVGKVTKEVEVFYTKEGSAYANITLAIQKEDRMVFINCKLNGKVAEKTALYCKKDSVVGITGSLDQKECESRDGRKAYITEVIADSVQFLSFNKRG